MARSNMLKHAVAWPTAIVVFALFILYGLGVGWFVKGQQQGDPVAQPRSSEMTLERVEGQTSSVARLGQERSKQILFGDLHVHSTFSGDAFAMSLPLSAGEGAHPISDACDYARFCSALDFWSINDHATAHTPKSWQETITEIRQCNAVAEQSPVADTLAFLGWEWTQVGVTEKGHYGHKNVILRGLADNEITTRPIIADAETGAPALVDGGPPKVLLGLLALKNLGSGGAQYTNYLHGLYGLTRCDDDLPSPELPANCAEFAQTPADLFRKLDEWGVDSIIIPHGTTWGMYTPPGSSWDKQLTQQQHDPNRQKLIEIYSGHGNAEEYRSFREINFSADGSRSCPNPQGDYIPDCWRAGEITEERCTSEGLDKETCFARAEATRQYYVDGNGGGHHLAVPGAKPNDWLDAGQCPDCFLPAFKYRPKSSVQYIMSLGDANAPEGYDHFQFGFVAASDIHSSRPGTGYKEHDRWRETEARFKYQPKAFPSSAVEPIAEGVSYDLYEDPYTILTRWEFERAGSYFTTGGLTAVHADSRDRDAVWDAWQRKEVYGTSGPRILLWFDAVSEGGRAPMGSEIRSSTSPTFEVTAIGSLEQNPGCPEYGATGLTEDRLDRLCRGECYNPSDERRPITRIEVIRILPRQAEGETPEMLIQDPWRVLPCPGDKDGCQVSFTDDEFATLGRPATYYVRAIEAPSQAIGAVPMVCENDANGRCRKIISTCNDAGPDDNCLGEVEERAWSSPIFVRPNAS